MTLLNSVDDSEAGSATLYGYKPNMHHHHSHHPHPIQVPSFYPIPVPYPAYPSYNYYANFTTSSTTTTTTAAPATGTFAAFSSGRPGDVSALAFRNLAGAQQSNSLMRKLPSHSFVDIFFPPHHF